MLDGTAHAPLPVKVIVYVPAVLAPRFISPVEGLIAIPAGDALNVPPEGLFITGIGFGADIQIEPAGYLNWGLVCKFIVTVTGVRVLIHCPTVFCT